ncbi:uncharacterized protein LDX57_006052 [Aspergillus melleus]|uniref:uncharacterized protein n=1 Tax=Aspergillus melleus TaxID=138277 RepID=UPI001E8D2AFD|nr:uncharacterized protein LDX57_006052 [Aspergillus melleus]KAH8428351.1 hypothetical protein LDX57_006052 [Aspergillus melleus]
MAATVTEAVYNHSVYHSGTKPSLHAAIETFNSRNVQHYINTVIRDCFLKHRVEKAFSACILHRHFDLNPGERNIEENGQAVASTNLNNIHACSWLFHNEKLFPYEFKRGGPLPKPPAEFITELGSLLQSNDLCDIIGVQVYEDGIVGMESTDHAKRISTTINYPEMAPELKERNAKIASFAFF